MRNVPYERLIGIIVGVFLVRAFDSLLSMIGSAVLLGTSWGGVIVALIPVILPGLMAYGYLLHDDKRWLHISVLCLTVLGALSQMAILVYFATKERSEDDQTTFLAISTGSRLVGVLLMIWLVYSVYRKMINRTAIDRLNPE